MCLGTRSESPIRQDGVLFVEVPDIETSPFDLLVADHLLHFSRATLDLLLVRCGLCATTLSNEVIRKEITALTKRGKGDVVLPDPQSE